MADMNFVQSGGNYDLQRMLVRGPLASSDSVARRLVSKLSDIVSVKDFGAVGDGSTDDTAAIQAAIDYAESLSRCVVFFPAGSYLVSSTLTVEASNVLLLGEDMGACRILRTDGTYGDTILIASSSPSTTRLSNVGIAGFTIECDAEMTSGAHLNIKDCIHVNVNGLHLWDGYISMNFEGLQQAVVHNTRIDTGTYYTSGIETGTRMVQILDANNASNETGEVFFSDFNWTFTGNANIEYGLYVRAGDGIWFSNGHIFGANEELKVSPQTSTTQLQGLHFDNVWFDGSCAKNISIVSNSTAGFGDFEFVGCVGTGATDVAVEIGSGATDLVGLDFIGGRYGNCDGTVFDLDQGDVLTFSGVRVYDGNDANAGLAYGINLGTGVRNVTVTGGYIGTQATSTNVFDAGINVQDATINSLNISGVHFENCVDEIALPGHMQDDSKIVNCTTNRASYEDVAAANDVSVPAVAECIELTGASTTVNTIAYGWQGRKILLRAVSNSQTIAHDGGTGNGKIFTKDGTNQSLGVNRGILLTYNAAAPGWYQSI